MKTFPLYNLASCSWCGESFFRLGEEDLLCGPCREAARKQIRSDDQWISKPRLGWKTWVAAAVGWALFLSFVAMVVAVAVLLVRAAAGV